MKSSLHLINGAFSQRFATVGKQLGKQIHEFKAPAGTVVYPDQINIAAEPELVAITHNETSTGVQQPLPHLEVLRSRFPEALLSVDVVSSFPLVNLPFETIDMAYFSVQKCLGLPAGLGVWIINQPSIERALSLQDRLPTAYHGIPSLLGKVSKVSNTSHP